MKPLALLLLALASSSAFAQQVDLVVQCDAIGPVFEGTGNFPLVSDCAPNHIAGSKNYADSVTCKSPVVVAFNGMSYSAYEFGAFNPEKGANFAKFGFNGFYDGNPVAAMVDQTGYQILTTFLSSGDGKTLAGGSFTFGHDQQCSFRLKQ